MGLTAILLPARLQSSRLQRKMMTDVAGHPALWHVLHRMNVPKLPELRVVCTSTNPADREIAEYAEAEGWKAYRGDEEDVLLRYLQAATHFGIDFFVNVDGDDLFCSQEYVDRVIERFRETNADYIQCQGLPFGGAPLGIKVKALELVCQRKEETNTQGWGKYFVKSGLFKVETLEADPAWRRPDYRMTLDYPEDLEFFNKLLAHIDPARHGIVSLGELVQVLDAHPEVAAISQQVNEQYWERFNREHGNFRLKS